MHVEITTIDGRVWVAAPEGEDSDCESLHEVFANLEALTMLYLDAADGSRHYFNPAHIIAASVIADEPAPGDVR